MTLFYITCFLYAVGVNAVLGRIDGGGIIKMSEWLERLLIMGFFVMACSVAAGWWGLLAGLGVFGIATGHGQYFLSRAIKPIEPERVDPIVSFFFGRDPRTHEKYKYLRGKEFSLNDIPHLREEMALYGLRKLYWRNVFGMFVTGSLVGLFAFLVSIFFIPWYISALFLLTGPSKALAYMIGYKLWKSTVAAEYINGGFRGVICALVIFLSLI